MIIIIIYEFIMILSNRSCVSNRSSTFYLCILCVSAYYILISSIIRHTCITLKNHWILFFGLWCFIRDFLYRLFIVFFIRKFFDSYYYIYLLYYFITSNLWGSSRNLRSTLIRLFYFWLVVFSQNKKNGYNNLYLITLLFWYCSII